MANFLKKTIKAFHDSKGKLNLGDMRLNKKGTVGTEPIMKMTKRGPKRFTEVKLGKLGKIDIPNRRAGY